MKIRKDFIRRNKRVQILSNDGKPTKIPKTWGPILGGCDMIVVIPDMHMFVRNSPLDNFHWVAKTMIEFLDLVADRKDKLDEQDKLLRVYQLGDLYELRFPSPSQRGNATVSEITMSDNDYSQILNQLGHLSANMLYGNHDFENRHYVGYDFAKKDGAIYMEHGCAADIFACNPALPGWDIVMYGFLKVRELNDFIARLAIDLKLIPKDSTFSIGVTPADKEVIGLVTDKKYRKDFAHIKDHYCNRMRGMPQDERYRISIVGHTHAPHFDDAIDGGEYMYIDAGAWTEGRSTFVVATNEEIALCHFTRA